ncbi:NADH-quinone oxidoreductase subunit NuoE family protein [Tichowtungia aerotolerans]|uniref:Uncharacterized protein n=1 Tax=Tichowtungia aerotolerans TaxID=2697043 RepID=A0A6P1M2Q7_9BACT|nr:hypothetical protein [Tichowtungia aerotolerans]QHI68382.1 hypothetical protein GT409_02555 [Tichowtungia aerotolerans]
MDKIVDVEICTGTTCFVMGAGHLMSLAEELPERLKGSVSIRFARCLGVCSVPDNGRPPFATVNGALIENASVENLVAACDLLLSGEKGMNYETV